MKSRRSCRTPVRGAVLVQFAMLSWAIMGIMAVAIDLGMLRSVQSAMRTGTEAAALEGMRQRDSFDCPPLALPDDCALFRDLRRRIAARRALAQVYDEDLDLATRNVYSRLGVGGFIDTGIDTTGELLPDGLDEDLDAYNPSDTGFIPFQLNVDDNFAHGDMVAGDFAAVGGSTDSLEGAAYDRPDFTELTPVQGARSNSFLVRMRRGNDPFGLDRVDGVSSSGPAVPILFGLGAMISKAESSRYDPRTDGFTVRSTAIAGARPALAVGVADLGGDYDGYLPFTNLGGGRWSTIVIDANRWTECVTINDTPQVFTVTPDGAIQIEDALLFGCVGAEAQNIGRAVSVEGTGGRIVEFGNTVSPLTGTFDPAEVLANRPLLLDRVFYVPLVRTFRPAGIGFDPGCADPSDPSCYEVIGFGGFRVVDVSPPAGLPGVALRMVNLPTVMAKENATSLLRSAASRFANMNPYVRQAYQALEGSAHVQAPVLVR